MPVVWICHECACLFVCFLVCAALRECVQIGAMSDAQLTEVLSQDSSTHPCNAGRIEVFDDDNSIIPLADTVQYYAADLHIMPYTTEEQKLVATLSILNRCYGRELDRVIRLFEQLGGKPIVSSLTLGKLESEALHQGMQFVPHIIDVPKSTGLPQAIEELYPVQAIMRRDLGAAVAEMITRPYVWPMLHMRFQEIIDENGVRVFEGFYSGNAWKRIQQYLGEDRDLVGLLIFSDSTQILRFNTRSLHPIYMCPAGLKFEDMSLAAMSLIGFMPAVPSSVRDMLTETQKRQLASWTRLLLASVYANVIKQIHKYTEKGLVICHESLRVNRVHPFVITAISDHVEGNSIALLELLACRYCTLDPDLFAATDSFEFTQRTSASGVRDQDHPLLAKEVKPFRPFFTSHCIFHDIEEGIWKWFLDHILLTLFQHPADQDIYMGSVLLRSRFPGLQHLDTLTSSSTKNLTARQHRQQLVQLTVTIAALTFRDDMKNSVFVFLLTLCEWYALVRSRAVSEQDLQQIKELTLRLRRSMRTAATTHGIAYDTRAIKHHVILHYVDLIQEFGAMLYQSCEMWDGAHKFMIKCHLASHGGSNFQQVVERRVRHTQAKHRLNC
jgi:hypothetical protein